MDCPDRTTLSQALHELRNPLSVIQMVLDRLSDNTKPLSQDRYDRYLQRAQASTALMEGLMTQLSQLEFLNHSPILLSNDRHSISHLIAYLSQRMTTDPIIAWATPTIPWVNHCDPSTVWCGDPGMMWQVLRPILQNALQYGPGLLQILWQTSDAQTITIDIQDPGEGIDPQDRPHLWQPFYRGRAGKQSDSGFGLGLTIAQAAVLHLGGEISFHPLTPMGSSCRVTLPHPVG
ncbi:MAG: HAMP domain-containing histidine kinase [Alkalinema sp. RU_4_3]|nr:HAMP domain-containing histidine kinase [Alkalinema sp. RU_4_3]